MAEEKGTGLGGVEKQGLEQNSTSTPYDGIVNDPEMEGLTLYEKKALLINRELDSHGMGKYQVFRVRMTIKATVNDSNTYLSTAKQYGNLSSSFSAGLTAGVMHG
ncbi:MAG: hypothetical protein Q9191_000686 [Dirinaria sp. TL-2023a]